MMMQEDCLITDVKSNQKKKSRFYWFPARDIFLLSEVEKLKPYLKNTRLLRNEAWSQIAKILNKQYICNVDYKGVRNRFNLLLEKFKADNLSFRNICSELERIEIQTRLDRIAREIENCENNYLFQNINPLPQTAAVAARTHENVAFTTTVATSTIDEPEHKKKRYSLRQTSIAENNQGKPLNLVKREVGNCQSEKQLIRRKKSTQEIDTTIISKEAAIVWTITKDTTLLILAEAFKPFNEQRLVRRTNLWSKIAYAVNHLYNSNLCQNSVKSRFFMLLRNFQRDDFGLSCRRVKLTELKERAARLLSEVLKTGCCMCSRKLQCLNKAHESFEDETALADDSKGKTDGSSNGFNEAVKSYQNVNKFKNETFTGTDQTSCETTEMKTQQQKQAESIAIMVAQILIAQYSGNVNNLQ